ncbi:VPLPA-CTERM sorting domain-containing protein [Roseobacter weihaiensis]|uniref:VPLPA-CTERM sorting domain-containing protein n=1 Tax=Roseobacter weihaiensis TaxID=2763262 RepID=UPI001D0AB921|nr:VPLPA-CTERM sorting domain-containing protein [Roseobacter sp. H9]
MYKASILAGIFAMSTTAAFGAVVDFENESPLNPDPNVTNVGTSYSNGGITFTSTEDMQLVKTGGPSNGFVPNDSPNNANPFPVDFGDIFLTGDFNGNTDMTLSFGTDLAALSFDIVDIDGPNNTSNHETFVFSYFYMGAFVDSITVSSDDTTLDAEVVTVSYSGLFDEVQIVGTTPGGTRNIGWGIDNINVTAVPLPAAGFMLLSALGGMGLMRRRKRAS